MTWIRQGVAILRAEQERKERGHKHLSADRSPRVLHARNPVGVLNRVS